MDPDQALRELLDAIHICRAQHPDDPAWRDAAAIAVDRAEALDSWISHGHYLPDRWTNIDNAPSSDRTSI